jgi:bacteriocin-like protein
MRNDTCGNELTIDELKAVSGGSLPLPAIGATIVRAIVGPDSPLPLPAAPPTATTAPEPGHPINPC